MKNSKLWFKAKSYGYGWVPSSIEGWLTLIAFIIIYTGGLIVTMKYKDSILMWTLFSIFSVIEVFALIIICVLKGEKPKWNWGNTNN